MQIYRIYKITNLLNGKVYVGQTRTSVSKRFYRHKCKTNNTSAINAAIQKYGVSNFSFEEIYNTLDLASVNWAEQYFINYFNSMTPAGYNLRPGGHDYGQMSDLTKSKISKSKTGKGNPKRLGELRDESYRYKISKGLGGKPVVATCLTTGRKTIYLTVHETTQYGFEPWNVVAVCKGKRKSCHGHTFSYYTSYNANQNGSQEIKIS